MALIRGGSVRIHAQAFADACERATGARNFGTYPGHDPQMDRALDIFTPVPNDRRAPGTPGLGRVLGDDIADFALANITRYGIWYVIWRQHIFNPEIARYWRAMGDRGGVTQNHFDHPHVSFYMSAAPIALPPPAPIIHGGQMLIVNVQGDGIYLLRGDCAQHLLHPDHVLALVKAGVPYQDKASIPQHIFNQYLANPAVGRGAEPAEAEAMPYDEMVEAVQGGLRGLHDEYLQEMLQN